LICLKIWQYSNIAIGLTINTFEGRAKELFEPNSPNNEARLNALKILKENRIKTYGFISPVIPGLINLEDLLAKSRDLVDYYIVEFLNINAAGSEFRQLLKENFPESYAIANDRKKLYLLWKIRGKF